MRIVFAGTPDVAVPSLDALLAAGHDVAAVVTRPDAPVGRKRVLTPSPVAHHAEALGLKVLKSARADDALTAEVAALAPELGVVVAYGGLLRRPLLETPRLGWINLHFSLLPRWRGAAPVQRAVIAGDEITGANVFQLEEGLDTGPVFGGIETPTADKTAGQLLDELSRSGAGLLADVVARLADGTAVAVPQQGEATHAPKLSVTDGVLDVSRSAEEVLQRFRGTTPEPGASLSIEGDRVKVLAAAAAQSELRVAPGDVVADGRHALLGTGSDAIELLLVQPAGRKPMPGADWLRGRPGAVRVEVPE
ncbi:methionyl-tRNA formyltransferase [Herbiconiux sp. L3-i23]|uniref:methionyl-tRNA formyltransferase n=1 Tax=Herbiconiux sp. L3-i23 TaxID=2905871 RepID=UPI0020661B22|nr:methionyl-tRNA formyltransferase [Herbiconiux sp. L3-i23]BDI22772.1 methionyl-tRNA formyltransferase [Herbiconiux sp. L3-i23]